MKRALSILLVLSLIFSCLAGCGKTSDTSDANQKPQQTDNGANTSQEQSPPETEVHYTGLDDPELLRHVEDQVYHDLVYTLGNDKYYVENVEASYVSKEYLEELDYNSRANIYFGYTLAELQNLFQGKQYVFSLGEDGQTIVKEFESYDDSYEQAIRNVMIGTGVILVCVTIAAVSAPGLPAISAIFWVSAKTGTELALSAGTFAAVSSGLVTWYETGDFESAKKAAALSGSEAFKWGAITGAIAGGTTEAMALRGATLNGLSMNEAALIQKESGYPLDVIRQFHSMKEYQVYREAGLNATMVNGRIALVQDIDLSFESDLAGKTVTNLERMQLGYAPVDPSTGKFYQLHHVGQRADGTLAILTEAQHQGNSVILNTVGKASEIDRAGFSQARKAFWQAFADLVG